VVFQPADRGPARRVPVGEYIEWNKVLGVPEKKRTLVISDEAHEYMRAAIADTIKRRPVWLPRVTPPVPWTGFKTKPSEDTRVLKHARS
jgi:hypothetical protein